LAEHFKPVTEANGVKATVIVEASDRYPDNKWVLDITKKEKDHYVGLVANLGVGTPDFEKQLEEISKDSRFVGIRIRPRAGFPYFSDKFWKDLKALSKAHKTLDILMVKITLPQVAEIAKRNPNLKILINHLTGLVLSEDNVVNDEWRSQVAAVAKYPNVYCKVSGGLQRAGLPKAPADYAFYKPCLDVLAKEFGADRLVYGSNWPVTEKYGSYSIFKNIVIEFCQEYDRDFAEKVLYKNAIKFYNLPELKN
jgi:L-fuconolactonase